MKQQDEKHSDDIEELKKMLAEQAKKIKELSVKLEKKVDRGKEFFIIRLI